MIENPVSDGASTKSARKIEINLNNIIKSVEQEDCSLEFQSSMDMRVKEGASMP